MQQLWSFINTTVYVTDVISTGVPLKQLVLQLGHGGQNRLQK